MSSTSERGHAKNLANAVLLSAHVKQLNAIYKPTNPSLQIARLESIYNKSFSHQEAVNNAIAPYSLEVDHREKVFAPLNKKLTKLGKAYKVTEGVTAAMVEDFMTISRKIRGVRKSNPTATENNEEGTKKHSVAQTSYDQRTHNFALLIALLQNTPNYNPNEVEYQVATLQNEKAQMLQATQNVTNAYIPLTTARANRNNSMYLEEDNLVDTNNKVKDYLVTILDKKSDIYKAIVKIKFKKA